MADEIISAPPTAPAVETPAATAPVTLEEHNDAAEAPYAEMSSVFDSLTLGDPNKPPEDPDNPAVVEPAPAAVVEPAKVEPPPVDYEAEYKRLKAESDARAAAPEPTPVTAQPAPAPVAEPQPAPPIYTADETEFLKKYREEWPDIARGEALARQAENIALVNHIYAQIAEHVLPLVQRGAQAADAVSESETISMIRDAHPDYSAKMYDDVNAWAEGLTGFEKKAAMMTIKEGDPEDVVDLISKFKEANPAAASSVAAHVAKPAAVVAPAAKPKATVTELSAAAKQAARAISAVDTKRTPSTPNSVDKGDFDGAWAEAMASASN